MGLRVVVAADIAGYDYKEQLKKDLEADDRVDEVIDVGIGSGEDVDYPHVAVAGARLIAEGKADRGLFVCGTGMGVAIAANKVPGIRASTAHDSFSVGRLALPSTAPLLTCGQRVIGRELPRRLGQERLGQTLDLDASPAPQVAGLEPSAAGAFQRRSCSRVSVSPRKRCTTEGVRMVRSTALWSGVAATRCDRSPDSTHTADRKSASVSIACTAAGSAAKSLWASICMRAILPHGPDGAAGHAGRRRAPSCWLECPGDRKSVG